MEKNHYSKTRQFFGFNNSREDDPAALDNILNDDCEQSQADEGDGNGKYGGEQGEN